VAVSLTGASGKRGPQGASSQRRVHGCASFRSIRIKEKTKKGTVSLGPFFADSRILARIMNGCLYRVREKE